VCVQCGELHPCHHVTTEAELERERRVLNRLTSLTAGHCWACEEPIGSRQRRIDFEGENLLVPGGPSPVQFHTRSQCHGIACAYEKRWVAHRPGRAWRLQCPGSGVHHRDAFVCTQGQECPGERTVHRSTEDHRIGGLRCARCGS